MKFSVTVQEKADLLIQVTVSGISTCYMLKVALNTITPLPHIDNG
jgi:hypothetical protein